CTQGLSDLALHFLRRNCVHICSPVDGPAIALTASCQMELASFGAFPGPTQGLCARRYGIGIAHRALRERKRHNSQRLGRRQAP
ncbi:MAG: hypothetical protein ACT6SC_21980, partial [Blastomonas fulva]